MTDKKQHEISSVACYYCESIISLEGVKHLYVTHLVCKKCNPPATCDYRWGYCRDCGCKAVYILQNMRWEHHDFDDRYVKGLKDPVPGENGVPLPPS